MDNIVVDAVDYTMYIVQHATNRYKPTITEHRFASVSRGKVALSTPCAVYIILISFAKQKTARSDL